MSTPDSIRVRIEIDGATGPIAGSVRVAQGASWRFSGWVQLLDALEAARGDGAGEPVRPTEQGEICRP